MSVELQTINGYNIDKALCLLGAADNRPGKENGICSHLCTFLNNLWITLLRVFNYIFCDHQWYNNESASKLIVHYYTHRDEYPGMQEKVDELYHALHYRVYSTDSDTGAVITYYGRTQSVYEEQRNALRGNDLSQPQIGTAPSIEIETPVLQETTEEGISDFVTRYLHQFITGRITRENAPPDRKGVMQLLQEQIESNSNLNPIDDNELQRIALAAYAKYAAQGLYINCRWGSRQGNIEADSSEFEILVNALTPALQIDFPNIQLTHDRIRELAREGLKAFNAVREAALIEAHHIPILQNL